MSIGTLIVKTVILAFNECQGTSANSILPSLTHLNQFLLTFQCLLPLYPELISLVELVE